MTSHTRPLQFRDYLPDVFRTGEVDGSSVFSAFLQGFETVYEELQAAIEGVPDGALELTGGIPDLFNPATTPPPQFLNLQQSEAAYLHELASWIGLPLRTDKSVDFNREFFQTAITLSAQRGTLPGLEALLRAWLKGDLLASTPPVNIITDLSRAHTDVDAVFQLNETATLGFDTVLGEGPLFFFIVDLIANPALSQPAELEKIERAARLLLDAEKPAHTTYQLRVRAPSQGI